MFFFSQPVEKITVLMLILSADDYWIAHDMKAHSAYFLLLYFLSDRGNFKNSNYSLY